MNISKSGYYKWLKNIGKLNKYEIDRLELQKLIEDITQKKTKLWIQKNKCENTN